MVLERINLFNRDEFFSVGLLAFPGALIRILIIDNFSRQNEVSATVQYGPFIQMFYVQPYLLPNFLGCFLMGIFYVFKNEMKLKSKALSKALTVGFCGSLTTFSSWAFTGFQPPFSDDNWYKIIVMYFMEFWLTWCAFLIGIAFAKYCKPFIIQRLVTTTQEEIHHVSNPDRRPYSVLDTGVEIVPTSERHVTTMCDPEEGNPDMPVPSDCRERPTEEASNPFSSPPKQNTSFSFCFDIHEYHIWLVSFFLVAIPLWITLILLSSLSYFDSSMRRNAMRGLCLAPLGAWLRWSLSKYSRLRNLWPEMKPHTLLANTLAVLLQSLLFVFSDSSWNVAINYGFNGSLSTVSTLFAELYEMNEKHDILIAFR
jgi:fluoride ion exporter CrcB/FEX